MLIFSYRPLKLNEEFTPKEKVKATMVRTGGGFPIATQIWLQSVKVVQNFGSTKLCLAVYFHEKGKRKVKGYRFNDISIALGWHDVKGTFNGSDTETDQFISGENGHLYNMTVQLPSVLFTTLPIETRRISLVVTGHQEKVLGVIYPYSPNTIWVLTSHSPYTPNGGSVMATSNPVRLASADDFKRLRVSFKGFDNENEYLFAK